MTLMEQTGRSDPVLSLVEREVLALERIAKALETIAENSDKEFHLEVEEP